ncbi:MULTISPECIES: UDP-3-O-(3-hydroxymyristoyl)glucosamine N-acyltransferase [unclassified Leeuwenhoekiella]|uniref:UDP-3-O-(3-hydroxymyristoyl)glucosamine N-acyltransferase n=1 Tax=unclassified Leeuwenhoekiella TaxID=2615029 RepID=UPI000C5AF838|nr:MULTISPECIES: UDP-3-O-(3-hydroxymyristoyl)glucosamine N-acyltransferase [unclassified Leeuwenhoekiella]MAW95313.1 UDP-3-O-(3-hydroxymyristoyl)glucosamine N-acyltransferase [Leeuwenhoekiella sp.]MBA81763.1 UDP-3-O-(3-hydroxymyristoyl)glucosamine N-acyltransferase [Leeuwenhoekiella sp.]|tara:strand:+ start:14060 stop:15052 length:993 start_codon:yes stop_codon:yes gene_type:complete
MSPFTFDQLAIAVSAEKIGDTSQTFSGLNHLDQATARQVSFIGSSKYTKNYATTKAGAVVINDSLKHLVKGEIPILVVKNADLAMAKLLSLYERESPVFETAISPLAYIHPTARIGADCKIGPGCYVGAKTLLSDGVTLYPNVTIMDEYQIGTQTIIWSGTVIRERSQIGAFCIFHNNVSIGADGFGYRPAEDGRGLVKIVHIGNVVIGNGVEIGANSCVDRGKFDSTIVGDGCKIDNLVQIAHNCILGKCCIMAGHSGLAGSVTLGDGVIIGGSASIKVHITIHSGAVVAAGSGVMGDVEAGKTVLGYPATESRAKLREWAAVRKLGKS